jgi:hypothetical protein
MRQRTEHHPLYGEIPLVEHESTGKDGRVYSWLQYDPNHKPKLPRGAVLGDVSRQRYCVAHHMPKYFYLDEQRTCIQCGDSFVFRGAEQKYWYETLKFNFGSVAVRCPTCRRKKRTEAALREQIGSALRQLKEHGDDPGLWLELARATVVYRERTGEGNLERAIGASRKAASLIDSPEPLFWEGRCHQLAGRRANAARCFQQFLAGVHSRAGMRELVTIAEKELAGGRRRGLTLRCTGLGA